MTDDPADLSSLDAWIKSLAASMTPADHAHAIIATAQARGAKIKKGGNTERILVDVIVEFIQNER